MQTRNHRFIELITSEQVELALSLLNEGGIDPNVCNHKQQSALQLAANRGALALVQRLLESGALVDAADQWGQTALMRAAYNAHHRIIEVLVGAGANVNARNAAGKPALLYAAENGQRETVELLLSLGADIDAADKTGATALMFAAARSVEERGLVRLILKRCTNALARDHKAMNALDYALGQGHSVIAEELKKHGLAAADQADLDAREAARKPNLIRRVVCIACGAPKRKPYRSPYIYCDYCASYIDWDYRAAMAIALEANAKGERSRESQAALKELQHWTAEMVRRLDQGDADGYGEAAARQIDAHSRSDPESYSPRMADADYRQRYLEYVRRSAGEMVRNTRVRRLLEEQDRRNRDIQFADNVVEPISFWKLFEAAEAFRVACIEAISAAGIFDLHPDEHNSELTGKISASTFLQAWLPYLSKDDAKEAIARCGLEGDYQMAEALELESRHCGKCGAEQETIPAAKRVICEQCGVILDTEAPEFRCPSCRFSMSLPLDAHALNCPACDTLLSRTGNAGQA